MLFSAPLDVARTNASTFASRWTSASVRWEPMKPSAPVTRHVRPEKYSPNSRRRSASASSVQVESGRSGFMQAVLAEEQAKVSPARGRSALRSGALTGLSYVALSLAAALAGAFLAHKFGRNVRTDGFMAAYGVYLVLVLGAQAFRMVVVPDLTRAEEEGRLGAEFRAYCLAFLVVAVPASVVTAAFAGFFGELVTGRLPQISAAVAADALPWLIPAAFLQLLAALAASALAARNSYGPAALSLSLIATAPLTRRGLDTESAAAHVVNAAWVSLALVGAASGLVALVGGRVVTAFLGDAFAGNVGDELGRLVVYLAPWMIANAAFSITYPLMFVMHRTQWLVPIAFGALLVDIPISIVGRSLWGLTGVTVALGVAALLLVLGLMASLSLRMLALSALGLARLSLLVGAATALAFGGASLVFSAVPAAAAGLALYALLLVAMRELGLAQAWHYVRALH